MISDLTLHRLIHSDRKTVFNHFVDRKLLELWCAPDGMTLRVPYFDARVGGAYQFRHNAGEGDFVCEGRIREFQPGSKLVQIESATGPDGKAIFSHLETVTTFTENPGGTYLTIFVKGFTDEKFKNECETGWEQCLNKLDSLFTQDTSAQV